MAGVVIVFIGMMLFVVAPMYFADLITTKKGRGYGWLWGLLLGWIGVLVVALLSPKSSVTT